MSDPNGQAWYVYAILDESTPAPDCEGVLPDTTVDAVPIGKFAVLVSLVQRASFDANHSERRTDDADWVARAGAAHHAVNVQAGASGPCLPIGFATLFSSLDVLRTWLLPHEAAIKKALSELEVATEWCLSIKENLATSDAWLDCHDSELAELIHVSRTAGRGTAFLMGRRIENARAVARSLRRSRVEQQITALLSTGCREVVVHPTNNAWPKWTMLAPKDLPSCRAACLPLDGIEDDLARQGLSLRLSGPWPAYGLARAVLAKPVAHV